MKNKDKIHGDVNCKHISSSLSSIILNFLSSNHNGYLMFKIVRDVQKHEDCLRNKSCLHLLLNIDAVNCVYPAEFVICLNSFLALIWKSQAANHSMLLLIHYIINQNSADGLLLDGYKEAKE